MIVKALSPWTKARLISVRNADCRVSRSTFSGTQWCGHMSGTGTVALVLRARSLGPPEPNCYLIIVVSAIAVYTPCRVND